MTKDPHGCGVWRAGHNLVLWKQPMITGMPALEGSEAVLRDDDLRRYVAAELFWDPRVDSEAIDVSAADGTVTLRGTVASLWLKRAGGGAAARVRGVTRVANELRGQLPDAERRGDDELRGRALVRRGLGRLGPRALPSHAHTNL